MTAVPAAMQFLEARQNLQYAPYRRFALRATPRLPMVAASWDKGPPAVPQLSAIAAIQQGLQFRKGLAEDPASDLRAIQIRDFDEQNELPAARQARLTRIERPATAARYVVQEGDVLFLARGQRNFAWAVLAPMPNTVAVGYFFILRPDPNQVHPPYLAWFLNLDSTLATLRSTGAEGSHMPIIKRGAFERLEIPLPPLAAQRTVAELESLRRREARLMRRLETLRQRHFGAACFRAAQSHEGY